MINNTKTYIYDLKLVILKMQHIDDLDLRLLSELKKNGNISVPVLSKKLEINASVLYSRIKRLLRKKMIKKFTIDIDESQLGFQVKASVGINRDPKFKNSIHDALMQTAEIEHLCEVTGRFDIIISVLAKDLATLSDSASYTLNHLCSSGVVAYLCPRCINHSCSPIKPKPKRLFVSRT